MEFMLLASAHFMALLSPGPDFFLIVRTGLRLPKYSGLALCAGIAVANAVYIGLALLGIETIRENGPVLEALRFLGSGYLLYLGYRLLTACSEGDGSPDGQEGEWGSSWFPQFRRGFLSAILNPKNMIFYLALFTSMVSPDTLFSRRLLYGIWMASVVFLWDSGIVLLTGNFWKNTLSSSWTGLLDKIAGLALMGFGLVLFFA